MSYNNFLYTIVLLVLALFFFFLLARVRVTYNYINMSNYTLLSRSLSSPCNNGN